MGKISSWFILIPSEFFIANSIKLTPAEFGIVTDDNQPPLNLVATSNK